jgi:hypothetical protein
MHSNSKVVIVVRVKQPANSRDIHNGRSVIDCSVPHTNDLRGQLEQVIRDTPTTGAMPERYGLLIVNLSTIMDTIDQSQQLTQSSIAPGIGMDFSLTTIWCWSTMPLPRRCDRC